VEGVERPPSDAGVPPVSLPTPGPSPIADRSGDAPDPPQTADRRVFPLPGLPRVDSLRRASTSKRV